VGIALLAHFLQPDCPSWLDALGGVVAMLLLTWGFYTYQRRRFDNYDFRAARGFKA